MRVNYTVCASLYVNLLVFTVLIQVGFCYKKTLQENTVIKLFFNVCIFVCALAFSSACLFACELACFCCKQDSL